MRRERTLDNLERLQAFTQEVPLVVQPVFSVHSVEFGAPGQIGQPVMSQFKII